MPKILSFIFADFKRSISKCAIGVIIFCFFFAPTVFAQGAFVAGSAQGTVNGALRSLSGATVTVCAASTAGVPCAPPLAGILFTDSALTHPLANPTTTDANGNYNFAVAAGTYTLTITATGFSGSSQQITVTCGTGGCTVSSLNVTGGGSLGGTFSGNPIFSGNISSTGLLAPANLANSVWACSTSVVFLYQTLAAGYAALPSSGGTVEVCSGHTETLAANLVLSKSNSGFHFNGPALITQGSFQITAAGGVDGLFIAGPWPMDPLQGYQGVEFSYSGTSDAMVFGNSSTHSFGLRLENFQVSLFSASGSAQAIHIIGTTSYDIRNVGGGTAIGSNSMNGLVLDGGTGTLFTGDGIVYNWASENFCSAIIFTGTAGHGANNNTVIGGKSVGSTQAGCATLNFLDGDLNTVVGFDMEGSPIGTSFANVADVFGNSVEVENEGNTTDVSFGAASSYNRFVARNLSPVVAGAGAPPTNSNSVVWYDSFAQDASGNFYLNLIKSKTGTATMGLTLKGGSGSGNYTSASTTFTAVDATNLTFTVTVPTGWKLGIQAFGTVTTATGVATANVNLTNGTCGSGTALNAMQYSPAVASAPGSFALGYVLAGSGSSVTINLCYDTSNAADSVTILNSSASLQPQMIFTLMPSN